MKKLKPAFVLSKKLKLNQRQRMDGLKMLNMLDADSVPLVFFDPQYRSVLDKQHYGNEKTGRQKLRALLPQISNELIKDFFKEIKRVLSPSGHVMVWIDKFILCSGISSIFHEPGLKLVDMITWNKLRMGMGYRSRRYSEHLVIFQKPPIRAKGIWQIHNIPDVWTEKIKNKNHPHSKPIELQKKLIEAVTNTGDIVVDPCAGGYSIMESAISKKRCFLGCDILG